MSGVDRGVTMKSNFAAVAVGIGFSLSAVTGAAQDCLEQLGNVVRPLLEAAGELPEARDLEV